MTLRLFLAAVIVIGAGAIIASIVLAGRRAPRGAYQGRPLMTGNELEFYGRLSRALPDLRICPQVAMHALIEPTSAQPRMRLTDFRRISQKVVDYAIFDKKWLLIGIVELDDRSHDRIKDVLRDEPFRIAGITTLRYESRSKPTEALIAEQVHKLQCERYAATKV